MRINVSSTRLKRSHEKKNPRSFQRYRKRKSFDDLLVRNELTSIIFYITFNTIYIAQNKIKVYTECRDVTDVCAIVALCCFSFISSIHHDVSYPSTVLLGQNDQLPKYIKTRTRKLMNYDNDVTKQYYQIDNHIHTTQCQTTSTHSFGVHDQFFQVCISKLIFVKKKLITTAQQQKVLKLLVLYCYGHASLYTNSYQSVINSRNERKKTMDHIQYTHGITYHQYCILLNQIKQVGKYTCRYSVNQFL